MRRWLAVIIFLSSLEMMALAQEATPQKKGNEPGAPPAKLPEGKLSDAERIARLQAGLTEDNKQRDFLQTKLEKVAMDIKKSSQEFTELDKQVKEKTQELQKLKDAKKDLEAQKLAVVLKDLQKQWDLGKERLDLVIQERKVLQDRLTTLDQKILLNRQELDRLTGAVPPKVDPGTVKPPPTQGDANGPKEEIKKEPEELQKARDELKEKEAAAKQAELEAKTLAEKTKALEKFIDLEQKLLETARKKADNAYAAQEQLRQELEKKLKEGAPQEAIQEIWRKIGDADRQATDARKEVRDRTDRLTKLQGELTVLNQEQILALQEAERKQLEAMRAKEEVSKLENPFAPRNMLRWLTFHGPKILLIGLGMFAFILLVRVADKRLVDLLMHRSTQKSLEERENRAKTLVGVFHNVALLAVLVGGGLMILEEIGIPIVPLMGGAAVVGLAVAFGAQNLIKDYFYGFMILVENQYGINDVITIGSCSGLVERITLRITVLRDLDGSVHFIPHGQVTTVTNKTHEWSRALFDVGVAYKEDVDSVMDILRELGKELRQDPKYGEWVLDDPEMLGVENLGDSSVVIRFYIKTKPLKQWTIKREMKRRIKKKFDELGIVIPFPQRTVYVHRENGTHDRAQELFARSQEKS